MEWMKMLVYDRIFRKLQQLGVLDVQEHGKKTVDGFMPLSVDRLGENRYAIAHNYVQNGDVMADPDMEIKVHPDLKMAEALTYQQDGLGIYQAVYPEPGKVNPKLKKELNQFLDQWLTNMIHQGFGEVEWSE
jgi:uncharacterized protein YqiB (DUF1249 family)